MKKFFKAAKGVSNQMKANFSSETMEARRNEHNIFHEQKEKNCQM